MIGQHGEVSISANTVAAIARSAFVGLGLNLAAAIMASQAQADDAAARVVRGRELFHIWACGSCHALADAGATEQAGPSLDDDPNLSEAFVVNRITSGQGAMPSFGDQLTDDEIADLAAYIMQVAE